ncbi:Dynamin-related GTPase protein [Marasmius tenuissimus]|uniref:Dynamin-related GTPase protein n=1 Tax=Marasmius tenuissimus TaxID=585030 RepID=A0ABR2ZHP9_9AGAR
MDSDLIKLVNKLQDTFHNLGGELDMPQLVVVGSQSAGKSSVLETIVGKDFLPRGQGIVTRRPLVLQLIHTPVPTSATEGQITEWGQFLHLDKRFTSYDEIRKEIEQETFRVAGQNKGISKLPISLRIYSPNVLDLTLVDLPGLTKIPVGDQPSDIERQIRNLVVEYISNPNSVILAVSPANVDLANSESLKLARSVDPQGRRTIGVLTKLDLMDAGTNAADILTGRVYPLKLGFIGVVNRSQQDINSEKSMEAALDAETEFFKNHPAYRNIAHKNGTRYLAKTLNQVLMNHIREKLPDMKARLNTLISQAQSELTSFGDASLYADKNSQGTLILRLMTQFARDFVSSIEGTNVDISTKELSGGARIYYIFNDVFGTALHTIDADGNLDNQDIRTAIRNSTGPRPSLFVPEVAFELLVKPQIKLLEKPSLRCVELVYEELVKICHNCTNAELQRFPRLHALLVEVVSELLRERLGPTSEYTQSLIEIQAAYINTNHPAFVAGSGNALAASANVGAGMAPSRGQIPPRPASAGAEPSSASASTDGRAAPARNDDSDDVSDDDSGVEGIFPPRDGRSVSSTVHDRSSRSRASTGTPNAVNASARSSSRLPHHQPPRPHSSLGAMGAGVGIGAPGSSPPSTTARETFLNYFFGGAPEEAKANHGHGHHGHGTVPTGRDVGLGATTSGIAEGKNAVFDMKSLGKHIEAVPPMASTSTLTSTTHKLTVREEMETTLIRSLISSYFSIVRQTIQDLVPKAIMHLLVNHTSASVQNRLVAELYKPEKFGDMLSEDEGVRNERERVQALLEAYREAFRTLSDVGVGKGV